MEFAAASAIVDLCIGAVQAVAAAGKDGLADTNHAVLYLCLSIILKYRDQRDWETKIRSAPMPDALAFCLDRVGNASLRRPRLHVRLVL